MNKPLNLQAGATDMMDDIPAEMLRQCRENQFMRAAMDMEVITRDGKLLTRKDFMILMSSIRNEL